MRANAKTRQAIEEAYAAFSAYGRPDRLDAAPARNGEKILQQLSIAPLRELPDEAVGPYAGWAMTTVGGPDDYRHFLPRILEVAVRWNAWMGTDPAVIASRLKMADWRVWAPREQAAIIALYIATWNQVSLEHPSEGDADDWLCGMAALGLDLTPYLARWAAAPLTEAALQMANFLTTAPTRLTGVEGQDQSFWDDVDDVPCAVVGKWLASDAVAKALKQALVEATPDDQWTLGEGQKVSQRLRTLNA